MEERTPDKIAVFDTLFTTKQIQIYKILFSYLPASFQKNFALYIKFSELLYTIQFFQKNTIPSIPSAFPCTVNSSDTSSQPDFTEICEEILPFLPPKEQSKLQQMKGMIASLKNMQEMMEMMEMMKDMFPEGMGDFGGMGDFSGMSDMMHNGGFGNFDPSQLSGIMEMMQAMNTSLDNSTT